MPEPQVLTGVLEAAQARHWHAEIDARAAQLPADHPDLQPTSGSMRLPALGEARFAALLHEMLSGPAGTSVHERLGPRPQVLPRQCWARRQWPPSMRPPGQAPHAWHQDGALHARFDHSGEALLPLVTVWVPLVACGVDSPSLEWIAAATEELLPPVALADDEVLARHGPYVRRHAVLEAGDALVFGGSLLHRTYTHPAMTRGRISVECRFVGAGTVPRRLTAEQVAPVRNPITGTTGRPGS